MIDPSIYHMSNANQAVPLQMPLDVMGQVQRVGGAMLHNQLMGQQVQEGQQSMADAMAMRKLAQDTGGDSDKFDAGLAQMGTPLALETQQKRALMQKQIAQAEAAQAKSVKDMKAADAAEAAKEVEDKTNAFRWVKEQGMNAPKALAYVLSHPEFQGPQFDELRNSPYDPMKLDYLIETGTSMKTKLALKAAEAKESKPGTPHAGIGPDGKPGFFTMGPNGQATPVAGGFKPMPTMPMVIQATGGQAAGGPGQPLSDPGMEAVAQAIARGDQAPQEYSVRNPAGKVINARAAMIAQEAGGSLAGKSEVAARASSLKDFETGGKTGQTINALNTMTEHLATARRMAEALNNGQFPIANKLANGLGIQLGQDQATNFATIKQFLAGEVAKVATGGHITEGEIHAAADRLNQAQSPAQLMGALDTMREVAAGKLVAINQDFKRVKGKSLVDAGRLTPATQAAFSEVDKKMNGAGGLPKDVQARVDALKAKGVPQADIDAALKKMGF